MAESMVAKMGKIAVVQMAGTTAVMTVALKVYR